MSKVKISSNLFLEVAEFCRLKQSFDDWGFKRHIHSNTKTYGIVKDTCFPELGDIPKADAFYVSKIDACNDKVSLMSGVAIDKNAEFVINPMMRELSIPTDGSWYWVKIKHFLLQDELGTVTVDTFGNVSGVNTEFTKILRGQPNFPSKIRFSNSTAGNGDDYEVVSVADDFNMVIQGDFINETELKYQVVGTFTPGYPVPTADELIFQYDDVEVELVPEVTLNVPPALVQDFEFYVARVQSNGITVTSEDKRTNWWRPWGENWVDEVNRNFINPLIGVEGIQYEQPNSPRAVNLALFAWGFRFNSYTVDSGQKKMSILIGNGGTFKDTGFFNTNDFTGWKVYAKNGSWNSIIDSVKSGSQIVLTLDCLNPDSYGTADELFIAPPFEMIEIRARKDASIIDTDDQDQDTDIAEPFPWPNLEKRWEYPINTQLARIPIPVVDDCYKYNITYRYRTFQGYTDWLTLPDDPIGYYEEESYDDYGNLKLPIDRTQKPYVGHPEFGFIEICEAPDSFQNFQDNVETGDLFGVNTTELSNSTPVVDLVVGLNKQYQHYKGSHTQTADMFIHLNALNVDGLPPREGNFFLLQIEQFVNLSTFTLKIVQNYVNPTSFDLVQEITQSDLNYAKNNTLNDASQSKRRGLNIRCTYNELGNWIATWDVDPTPKGMIMMVGGNAPANAFDTSGVGVKKGFWGWQIMNGQNGTTDMTARFVQGIASQASAGVPGTGSNNITIPAGALPEHVHSFSGTTNLDGAHSHTVWAGNGNQGGGFDKGNPDDPRFYTHPDNASTSRHQHNFSGTTDAGGGSGSPSSVDIRPTNTLVLFIEKYI
jgi:hypothetical protein